MAKDVKTTGSAKPKSTAAKPRQSAVQVLPLVTRHTAQAGREFSAKGVKVGVLPPAERLSLRAPQGSLAALSRKLGVTLPQSPKTSASKDGRLALWLGPDEWLVIGTAGGNPLADCAGVKELHSAVDVSHRNVGFEIVGPASEATLSAGCPQDLGLAVFPVGACSRTVLGKIEVVILRMAEDAFRVECWRSFSDYAFTFLSDAARDAAI